MPQARDARDETWPLLTAAEAARAMAIGERKLWEVTKAGELPCVRIGRCVRYVKADLLAWVQGRKIVGDGRPSG